MLTSCFVAPETLDHHVWCLGWITVDHSSSVCNIGHVHHCEKGGKVSKNNLVLHQKEVLLKDRLTDKKPCSSCLKHKTENHSKTKWLMKTRS